MPSPFPGMNPFLEHPAVWADFHGSLIPAIRALLNPQIRPTFFTRIAEFSFIGEFAERHPFLEICDRENQKLLTIVEVLSPANKSTGLDRQSYLETRRDMLAKGAHLVEFDLLRAGSRLLAKGMPACDYCAMVCPYGTNPNTAIWPFSLRDRVPVIPIPLRDRAPDAILDIKTAIDSVYDAAGYEDYFYRRSPEPPLNAQDVVWAQQFVTPAP